MEWSWGRTYMLESFGSPTLNPWQKNSPASISKEIITDPLKRERWASKAWSSLMPWIWKAVASTFQAQESWEFGGPSSGKWSACVSPIHVKERYSADFFEKHAQKQKSDAVYQKIHCPWRKAWCLGVLAELAIPTSIGRNIAKSKPNFAKEYIQDLFWKSRACFTIKRHCCGKKALATSYIFLKKENRPFT